MKEEQNHPSRELLHGEVHARPFVAMKAPENVSHIAMLCGENTAKEDLAHLAKLCERFGLTAPDKGNYFYADFGPFRLKWERHTEFCTYTFHVEPPSEQPFETTAIDRVPDNWLAKLPGECLVAIHVTLQTTDTRERANRDIAKILSSGEVIGSTMSGGARVWTDFHLHGDGYSRIIVQDANLSPFQLGRLVQRLLEIETYRMMALLGLLPARETAPEISSVDHKLSKIISSLSDIKGVEEERQLLVKLTSLAGQMEQISARTDYRFSATRAYYALVLSRIQELREKRIEGLQTISEFMERRLTPANETCLSIAARKAKLSRRITRTSNLLRTGVDISLEEQNHSLLMSMDRRAALQLRLQQTVEGLSVAAISYYLVSLVGYGLEAVHSLGVAVDIEIAKGASIPFVILFVWLGTRAVRKSLLKDKPNRK
ncbi:MAG: DUF3422 domain-containing protein [Sphingomonadales bacterium]|nr:DUF3422 domain-containing protein [Sphingomonadales bacterium]